MEFARVVVTFGLVSCRTYISIFLQCADPYMGTDQPGTPVDPAKPMQGPYGTGQYLSNIISACVRRNHTKRYFYLTSIATGMSGPIFGLCPGSRDWLKQRNGNPLTGKDWIRAPPNAPPQLDDTDDVMKRLAAKKIEAFSGIGHGFFFWNFRTDLYEPQWSYMSK